METVNHECYVSPEVANLLEKAGFDWRYKPITTRIGNEVYNQVTLCDQPPSLEISQRWLREVKGIHICVKPNEATVNCKYFVTVIVSDTKWGNVQDDNKKTIMFDTYEEAQESGIKKALDIILEEAE